MPFLHAPPAPATKSAGRPHAMPMPGAPRHARKRRARRHAAPASSPARLPLFLADRCRRRAPHAAADVTSSHAAQPFLHKFFFRSRQIFASRRITTAIIDASFHYHFSFSLIIATPYYLLRHSAERMSQQSLQSVMGQLSLRQAFPHGHHGLSHEPIIEKVMKVSRIDRDCRQSVTMIILQYH